VAAPGGHEEPDGEGDGEPVLWKEVLGHGRADGAGRVGFD
jgi:hypothetical protein